MDGGDSFGKRTDKESVRFNKKNKKYNVTHD